MEKKQIVHIIFAVIFISALMGVISLLMNSIYMLLYMPRLSKSQDMYTIEFYQKIGMILLIGGSISAVGIILQSLSFINKLRYFYLANFIAAAACIVCLFFFPEISHYFESTYYVDAYDLQLHQSAFGMLLQQAVYFILLCVTKLIMDIFSKNKISPTDVQAQNNQQ